MVTQDKLPAELCHFIGPVRPDLKVIQDTNPCRLATSMTMSLCNWHSANVSCSKTTAATVYLRTSQTQRQSQTDAQRNVPVPCKQPCCQVETPLPSNAFSFTLLCPTACFQHYWQVVWPRAGDEPAQTICMRVSAYPQREPTAHANVKRTADPLQ